MTRPRSRRATGSDSPQIPRAPDGERFHTRRPGGIRYQWSGGGHHDLLPGHGPGTPGTAPLQLRGHHCLFPERIWGMATGDPDAKLRCLRTHAIEYFVEDAWKPASTWRGTASPPSSSPCPGTATPTLLGSRRLAGSGPPLVEDKGEGG